jgi:hypothetical protein
LSRQAIYLVVFVLLSLFSAFGRKKPIQRKSGPAVVQVTTHLVQVNVIVKDDHGHPVPGLAQKDFTIFDPTERVGSVNIPLDRVPSQQQPARQ